jgi:hypothetical protein
MIALFEMIYNIEDFIKSGGIWAQWRTYILGMRGGWADIPHNIWCDKRQKIFAARIESFNPLYGLSYYRGRDRTVKALKLSRTLR